jgi:hypothetical protein
VTRWFWLICVLLAGGTWGSAAQITLGQIDDFDINAPGNVTLGWTRGANAPELPFVVATGGPHGSDSFLKVNSIGGSGSQSRMNFFNASQWTGNYVAAGVTQITAEVADFGTTPLYMRIAFEDSFGTEFGSTNFDLVPADGHWYPVSFDLTPAGLTLLQGSESAEQALTTVGILRVLSNAEMPSFRGDIIVGTLGLDEVAAVPEPGTTVCAVLCGLTLLARQRFARS